MRIVHVTDANMYIVMMDNVQGWLTMDELYDYDYCYECQGYGDDYYMDEHGEWVSACDDCPHNNAWRNDNG